MTKSILQAMTKFQQELYIHVAATRTTGMTVQQKSVVGALLVL